MLDVNTATTHINVSCNGGNDGSIDVTVSGGTLPYSYNWSNGVTTQDIGSLTVGSYTITVTDAKSCIATSTSLITEPAALTTSTTKVDASCNGASDGSAFIVVTSGTPPFTYTWIPFVSNDTFANGLTAGSYIVVVHDSAGCINSKPIVIAEPDSITISIAVTDNPCAGGNIGALDATISGGTPPYRYLWSNGATTEDISNLAAGTYTITVKDDNNCTRTATRTINLPGALTVSLSGISDAQCNGQASGFININVSGGTIPYSFLWSNGATTEDISNLAAGSYSVTITDINLCSKTVTYNIGQPNSPITIAVAGISDAKCNGEATGFIDITISGGTQPYTYAWSNGAATQDLSNIAVGSYSVTVTDFNNCSATKSIVIGEPQTLAVTGNASSSPCSGSNSGSITLTVTGGIPSYSFNWSNGATTKNLTGLGTGSYTITVTDSNSCIAIKSFSLSTLPAMTINSSVEPTVCGLNNGKIFVTASGGSPGYTYSWSTGATVDSITNLSGGIYTVTVTDTNSCQKIRSIVVNTYPSPDFTTSKTDVNCYGDNDGDAFIVITSGTPPFIYTWIPPVSSDSFANSLATGSYTIAVHDSAGCLNSKTVDIAEPDSITISIAVTNNPCTGGNIGALDATISGGTPPYTYLWSNGAMTEDISSLTAGSYTLTVTDAHNCTKSATRTISLPGALAVSISGISDAKCYGQASGFINITVSGGTPPYSFIWSNGATTEDISNVVAGSYSVTITDKNLCPKTVTYNIGQPTSAVMVSVSGISDAKCYGETSGFININTSGGTPGYTYLWSNGATTKNVSNLLAGSYQVTVRDANSCTKVANFNIGQPTAIAITAVSINDAVCFGEGSGSIDISVSGGTPPYSYLWSNGDTTQDISNVTSGNYTLTVTDGNSCSQTKSFLVGQSTTIGITIVGITNVTCPPGSNGAIDISVSGGTAPYTYSWSNGDTTQDISSLDAGTHTVTVTDAKNCGKQHSFNILQPDLIIITVSGISDVTCKAEANGFINISVGGGTQPYTFSWSNGDNAKDLTGLTAGSYMVTVTDVKGCTAIKNYNIGEPAAIAVNGNITNIKCFGDSTGAIEISTAGGTAPYSYSWSNGATVQNLDKVTAGTYTVTVTDTKNCEGVETFNINQPADLRIDVADFTYVSCNGGNNGKITVAASGGTSPYIYQWSNGMSTPQILNLVTGMYSLTVIDSNYCQTQDSVEIKQGTSMVARDSVTNVSCYGAGNGSINLTASGGAYPYSYSWSNGATTEDLNNLQPGQYFVTVSDTNNCTVIKSMMVTQPDEIVDTNTIIVQPSCIDTHDGSIELNVVGGYPPYDYLWSNEATTTAIKDIAAGPYSVTITDATGCTRIEAFNLTASTCNLPPIALNDTVTYSIGSTDISVMINDSDPDDDVITVTGIVTEPAHGTTVINSDGTITYTPSEGYTGDDAFTYVICDNGMPELCDTATVYISIPTEKPDLFIPTAISPNQDESNEYWEIRGINLYPENEVKIFNRWGNEVYHMNGYNNTWNGVNMKKEPLPDGTYYFILKLNDKDKSTYTGYVVIFRG